MSPAAAGQGQPLIIKSLSDVPKMTDLAKSKLADLMKLQTVSDVVSTIGKTDFLTDTSRGSLTAYLERSTIPAIPFGTRPGGSLTIAACPSATLNSSNRLTPDQLKEQQQHPIGYTLQKLTITPSKPTNLPAQTLRIFFTLGDLYFYSTGAIEPESAGFFVLLNPFDSTYWLLRDFYTTDENGIEHPTTSLGQLPQPVGKPALEGNFSLARIQGGKSLLGNTTAPLQLDSSMTFTISRDEFKVGGVLTDEDYQKAKADAGRPSAGPAAA
ncbi:hypothetical protein MMC11_005413 [Xylographa trunciseda]|nr:hypothetical protein [Xylographa trunciseda]